MVAKVLRTLPALTVFFTVVGKLLRIRGHNPSSRHLSSSGSLYHVLYVQLEAMLLPATSIGPDVLHVLGDAQEIRHQNVQYIVESGMSNIPTLVEAFKHVCKFFGALGS